LGGAPYCKWKQLRITVRREDVVLRGRPPAWRTRAHAAGKTLERNAAIAIARDKRDECGEVYMVDDTEEGQTVPLKKKMSSFQTCPKRITCGWSVFSCTRGVLVETKRKNREGGWHHSKNRGAIPCHYIPPRKDRQTQSRLWHPRHEQERQFSGLRK